MRILSKKELGFSLNELMITLLLLAFIMAGGYRFAARFTSTASGAVREAKDVHSKNRLEKSVLRELHRIGYNPYLIEYPNIYIPKGLPGEHPFVERMGLIRMDQNRLEFTSDDNLMRDESSEGLTGTIQLSEIYGLWVAEEDPAIPVDFASLLEVPGEGCVAKTENHPLNPDASILTNLDKTYRLYGKAKDLEDSLENPSVPIILDDSILCMEMVYYARGDPERCWWDDPDHTVCTPEKSWERIHADSPNIDFQPPAHPDDGGDEEKYYSFLRDVVRKIDVHILKAGYKMRSGVARGLMTKDDRIVKRMRIEFEIRNLPWMRMATTSPLPGAS